MRGKRGTPFNDRELAGKVRTLALGEIEKILKYKKNKRLYEAVIIRLSGSILPRLNEVSGPDGTPIPLLDVLHHNSNPQDSGVKE